MAKLLSGKSNFSIEFRGRLRENNPGRLYTETVIGDVTKGAFFEFGFNRDAYNISKAVFNQTALDFNAQDSLPTDIIYNNDGTKLYMLGQGGDKIHEYSLPVAYDISTGSYIGIALDISPEETTPYSMTFNNDGTKLYLLGDVGKDINEYSLSTPYDISTGAFSQIALDVSTEDSFPRDILYNDDGTKLYLLGNAGNDITEYSLSTPYDISTASFVQIALNVNTGTGEDLPSAMLFNNDGTTLYVVGTRDDGILEYTLSTPYDIATSTLIGEILNVASQEASTYSMLFNNDGSKLYITGSSQNDAQEFLLGENNALAFGANIGAGQAFAYIKDNSTENYDSDFHSFFLTYASSGVLKLYRDNTLLKTVYSGYDISTANNHTEVLNISTQESIPEKLFYNNDGTILYVLGASGDDINEYSLSTPYDISTGSFVQVALTVSGQDTAPTSAMFNDDGTILYVLGNTGDYVNEYSLSTPYDISTGTFSQIALSGVGPTPQDMLYNDDGTKLYIIESSNRNIYEFNLSTPYDISTGIFNQVVLTVISQDSVPRSIMYNSDGTKLYMAGNSTDGVHEYELSTPYDIFTATYIGRAFYFGNEESALYSMLFNNDGSKLYITGATARIRSYDLDVFTGALINADNAIALAHTVNANEGFIGDMQFMRFYNQELSPAEIQDLIDNDNVDVSKYNGFFGIELRNIIELTGDPQTISNAAAGQPNIDMTGMSSIEILV